MLRTNKKKMVVVGGAMAAMLALGAGPAAAEEVDFDSFNGD